MAPDSSPAETPSLLDKLKDPAVLAQTAEDAIIWATQHGLVMAPAAASPACAVTHAPLSLTPVQYPRDTFLTAKQAAESFSLLMDAVAKDEAYLTKTLSAAAQFDDFMARQLGILQRTAEERAAHASTEGVLSHLRSDYMLHGPTGSLLQVEINTIGVSFACLAQLTSRLHGYLLSRLGADAQQIQALPPNDSLDALAEALAVAAGAYDVPGAVVLMVVQPGERNLYDQQWAATRLWETHGVRCVRRTFAQLREELELGSDRRLRLGDGTPVAVVYLRAGYVPEDYAGDADWEVRERVERSDAFKCPSVAYQLAGAKKVQQDLAAPGVVERFLTGQPERAALVRSFFAGLWGLEDLGEPATAAAVADAVARPEAYVLKPQREGGGHNLYGEALRDRLREGGAGLSAYVLMQRIQPPKHAAVLVRDGVPRLAATLSELGIYSTLVRRGNDVLHNAGAGHLVRTKTAESDEGGVAAGYGVLDSPLLVD